MKSDEWPHDTTRISLHEYRQSAAPIDKAEVWFWRVDPGAGMFEMRAIYFGERVEWADSRWGDDRPGAGFEDEWAIERRELGGSWWITGRSNNGWKSLDGLLKGNVFGTFEAAREALVEMLESKKTHAIDKVERLSEALQRLNCCNDCARKVRL